jgi:hypothetical protein
MLLYGHLHWSNCDSSSSRGCYLCWSLEGKLRLGRLAWGSAWQHIPDHVRNGGYKAPVALLMCEHSQPPDLNCTLEK